MIEQVFERVPGSACRHSHTPNDPRGGESEQHVSHVSGIRVIEVVGLGHDAVMVDVEDGLPILFLDAGLGCDQRMALMNQVMAEQTA